MTAPTDTNADRVEPNEGEWIAWEGGECPVDADARVKVILRREDAALSKEWWDSTTLSIPAGELEWADNAHASDIVAYRVSK